MVGPMCGAVISVKCVRFLLKTKMNCYRSDSSVLSSEVLLGRGKICWLNTHFGLSSSIPQLFFFSLLAAEKLQHSNGVPFFFAFVFCSWDTPIHLRCGCSRTSLVENRDRCKYRYPHTSKCLCILPVFIPTRREPANNKNIFPRVAQGMRSV